MSVLHYLGYDDDRGGIVSVVRALAASGRFACWLGVNTGFVQRRVPALSVVTLPRMEGERISFRQFIRARAVARCSARWLAEEKTRVFHGQSRAGLLVALWLHAWGETRVVASIHCYGRQRWFYRLAARRLGDRLFWLSPAMRAHYRVAGDGWQQCIPGCVIPISSRPSPHAPGRLRLGGIGMLVRWKRWDLVIDALTSLPPPVRARVTFEHIGGPIDDADSQRYADDLRRRTAECGLADLVRWCGAEPSSARLIRSIDVLVIAAQNEPFSVAMLEALAAGVPVLAADSGGSLDVVRPGENGWRFQTGSSRDLARCLTMLVESDALQEVHVAPDEVRPFEAPEVSQQWALVYRQLAG